MYPIGLRIFDSTDKKYYENDIEEGWLMYESWEDALDGLHLYLDHENIVQGIAICDHREYSFIRIIEPLNAWANNNVSLDVDTIYLNGEHTLPTDI